MKNAIIRLLSNGYYDGKKYTVDDLTRKFYILKHIIRAGKELKVENKPNNFWNFHNNQNRRELIADLSRVHYFKMTDNAYFHIINRFENGDGYGIAREDRQCQN